MPAWIAFLRAVNVGDRAYPMAELRACVEAAGLTEAETHIQTGNLRVVSTLRSADRVAARLQDLLHADRGFEVATVVLRPAELARTVEEAEELSATHRPGHGHYVSLLAAQPPVGAVAQLEARSRPGERVLVRGRAVHLLLDVPYHRAGTGNAVVERLLGTATNRNLSVLRAIRQRWC